MMNRVRIVKNAFLQRRLLGFKVPSSYQQDKKLKTLSFKECFSIWIKSFKKDRLQTLQDRLTNLMLSNCLNENIVTKNLKTKLDEEGNYINELVLEVNNHSEKPHKEVVFIHGYGAALGCFARNYGMIRDLVNSNNKYRIHFLDNISFGLSSNPGIKNINIGTKIPRCPEIKINDANPHSKELINDRYYKKVDSFEVNKDEYVKYQNFFAPVLKDIESYYIDAIENWRKSSGIEKIDYLIGHSYGAYWSASYACKHNRNIGELILFSPVGVERHIHAVTTPLKLLEDQPIEPSLDPSSYKFLTRIPILSKKHVNLWYLFLPYLARILPYLGPWGVKAYFQIRYPRLFKVNKVTNNLGGPSKVFEHPDDLVIGKNSECKLIFDYLYNAITNKTNSDIYIKYLLTPSTVSKYPLFDKLTDYFRRAGSDPENVFPVHFIYGQYDFMYSKAGKKLIEEINSMVSSDAKPAKYYEVREGGHNFYLDNPFDTNKLVIDIVEDTEKHS